MVFLVATLPALQFRHMDPRGLVTRPGFSCVGTGFGTWGLSFRPLECDVPRSGVMVRLGVHGSLARGSGK